MYKCIELCSAINTGGADSRFIKPHEYDTISCPDECDSLKYTTQVIAAEITLKSLLKQKMGQRFYEYFQVSYAPFEDNGNFFYESLLRKGNKTDPPISVAFFKEYQKFIKV